MAETFLTHTNRVIARLNEVQLSSTDFTNSRGIQTQCKNAVNEAVRFINQKEFQYPFNHTTKTQTLTAGTFKYSIPTDAKTVDYNTFRLVKDSDLGTSGGKLRIIDYNDYVNSYITQEDEISTTTLSTSHTDSVTTITVASTTYTGTTSTTFTGATRGANSTTASAHDSGVSVAQFERGGIPQSVIRTPDNNYILYPYPTKSFSIKYDYFSFPSDMTAHGDTTTIPDRFAPIIADGATAFVYQYRGETQQYGINFARFEQGIKNMQTLLVNRFDYVRSTFIPRQGYSNTSDITTRVS